LPNLHYYLVGELLESTVRFLRRGKDDGFEGG